MAKKKTADETAAPVAEAVNKSITLGRMVLEVVSDEGGVITREINYQDQLIKQVEQPDGTKSFYLHNVKLGDYTGDDVMAFETAKRLAYNLTYTAKKANDAGVDPSVFDPYKRAWQAVVNASENWEKLQKRKAEEAAAPAAEPAAAPAPAGDTPATPVEVPEPPAVPEIPAEPAPPINHVNADEQLGDVTQVPVDEE